jgi:hypothetical protein
VPRGCGNRVAGGAYLTVKTSKNGSPLEYFLLDPPIRIDGDQEHALQLADVGVKLIERVSSSGELLGVFDVWDIVGQKDYPNVADVVEETRRKGVSRRIGLSEDFAKITPASRLFLLHRRAWIDNYQDYYGAMLMEQGMDGGVAGIQPELRCPKVLLAMTGFPVEIAHTIQPEGNSEQLCLGIIYEDVEGERRFADGRRRVQATVGDLTYDARERPDGVTPHYGLAIFARFPIHQIDVIRGATEEDHEEAYQKALKAGIPTELQDE